MESEHTVLNLSLLLDEMTTQKGSSLAELNRKNDVLLVFLRFFGCTFCRESIHDVSLIKPKLDAQNVKIVFVHMAKDSDAPDAFFARYQLDDIEHVTDLNNYFYQQFGLIKATPGQLISFGNWVRGFQSAVIEGHGFSRVKDTDDVYQMPGVFFLVNGQIENAFVHKMPFDRPNYVALIQKKV